MVAARLKLACKAVLYYGLERWGYGCCCWAGGHALLDFDELGILYKSIAPLIGLSSNSWALLVSTGVYKAVL